jgi:hypothetical protein
MENRNSDLPACSIVPQPIMLPRGIVLLEEFGRNGNNSRANEYVDIYYLYLKFDFVR